MMPIDTSMYQPGNLGNLGGSFLQGVQVAQQQRVQQQQLDLQKESQAALIDERRAMTDERERATAAAQRAALEEQKLRGLFSGETPPQPGQIYSIVGPERGAKILQGISALHEQDIKTEQQLWSNVASVTGAILALPEGMRPQAYQLARQGFIAKGASPEQIPEQYSPDVVQSFLRRAMTPEQQYQAGQPKKTTWRATPASGKLKPEQLSPKDIENARKLYQQSDDRPRVSVNTGNPTDVKEAIAPG
jgi:hypothetical protein